MRSLYIDRTANSRYVYRAFKRAYNSLYRNNDTTKTHHARMLAETGCKVVKLRQGTTGLFKNAVIEFERDRDYTMFILRWA